MKRVEYGSLEHRKLSPERFGERAPEPTLTSLSLPSPRGHVCSALLVDGRPAFLRVDGPRDRRTHPAAILDAVAELCAADPFAPDVRPAIRAFKALQAQIESANAQ
jgi:hypothetical protein